MDAAGLFLYACTVVLITIVNNACAIPITCEQLCSRVTDEQSQIYRVCGCGVMTQDKRQISGAVLDELLALIRFFEKTHPRPVTTPPPTTTLEPTPDICDTLCRLQLGGHACHCSMPGFPGRK
ncbi:uncharacterized protein LOC121385346 [Gigantopelta aegis]|uniref:uncharacterized protein LOC121385346 n=1 Tax=Gigantopelta aegis TaxID=1735272 RepID=UPI001B88DF6F|nr:uncharacterized protein LOC121385346 [Gigantopelta aegis]